MSLPPEEPTRPLRPVGGGPPLEPVQREAVVREDAVFFAEVMDRLRSLRTWVTVATVLSLLALGLAAWAYIKADEDRNGNRGNGVRAGEVEALKDRVKQLESQPDDEGVASADFNSLAKDQATLSAQVEELSAQVEELAAQSDTQAAPATAEDAEARESIAVLDESVSSLDARVQALEEQPAP
jgi:polyhydroxyalkanoate synthesis regulator phasin